MIIKKRKSLSESLRTLPSGEWHIVKNSDYKTNTVKGTITRLKKEGFVFMTTERGCIDHIKVLRINR